MKFLYFIGIVVLLDSFAGYGKAPENNSIFSENKLRILTETINPKVLKLALEGYSNIQNRISEKGNFLAIVDFSKSSSEKRFT